MCAWFRKRGPQISSRAATIGEAQLLRGEINQQSHQLTHELESLLDQVLRLFAPSQGLMAEVLVSVPETRELFTLELRPTTSAAMYFRLHWGQGIVGLVAQSGNAYAGDVASPVQTDEAATSAADVTHLFSTRAVLCVPIIHGEQAIGVLNVESPTTGALGAPVLQRLRDSGLLVQLGAELARLKQEPLKREQLIANLIDKLRQRIAFALNPEDMAETYYQVLRIAGQVVRPADVSGGLILVRDESQTLVEQARTSGEQVLYAVRAAKTGAFNSDPEWPLTGQSIAKRIINNRKGEVIGNARADPDYRESGPGMGDMSELIVPLVDGIRAFGVIGLDSPGLNAYDDTDLANLEQVADIAVYALQRAEEFRLRKRHSEQLRFNRRLLDVLGPLFPENMRHISADQIGSIRTQVSKLILTWALEQTDSEHGVFVLAEETPEGDHGYLVIHEYETTGELEEGGFRRWLATEGITGKAYTQRTTEYRPDVTIGGPYIPFFAHVRSEVASPLRIGDSVLGVLDVESNRRYHFTSDYVQWVEFLAEQAAFALATIDRAVKTHLEITLADLSQRIDKGIDAMRRRTEVRHIVAGELDARTAITNVRDARNDLVRTVIDTLLPLTGSWVGRFLIALNAYSGDGDDINITGGRLFYLVSTDHAEETNAERRFFPLTEGVSGKAFQEQRQVVFNDLKSRPDEYFDANPARDSLSGIFLPVWEGTRISGILNIESAHAQAFTPEIIRAFQIAADLASKIVTTARLRILVLLRQQLREFETVILRLSSADVKGFMAVALANAAELSSIDTGWGTVMMLSQPFPAGPPTVDQRFAVTYAPGAIASVAMAEDQPQVTYPIFIEAMRTKRPVLILDAWAMGTDQTEDSPWQSRDVRSIICVPLLRPPEGGQEQPAGGESARNQAGLDDREAVGVLALAHRNPAEFSEYDKEMLSLFAESVIQGLKNIKLLEARKELMDRLRHDISRAVQPLTHYVDGAHEAIADALAATDLQEALRDVRDVRDATTRIASLLELVVDLANWFLDLSNDDLRPERDSARGSAQEVVASAQGSLTALARQYGHQLVWDVPQSPPIFVEGGEHRARLIRAALFQYIDNALKYGNAGATVTVSLAEAAGQAIFTVGSYGQPIPEDERELIFQLYYRGRGERASDSRHSSIGSGIGLFQARQIAGRLTGKAYYRADPYDATHHAFCLSIPEVTPSAGQQEQVDDSGH